MRGRLIATALLAVLSAAAGAGVPPPAWKAPTWVGPGLLCGSAFALRLEEGERAVQGFPTVGVVPYTIESGGARFGIVEDWFSAEDYRGRKRLRVMTNGTLFALPARGADPAGATYLFVPKAEKALKFTLAFYAGLPGRTQPLPERRQEAVLDRIAFATAEPTTCLPNVNPE